MQGLELRVHRRQAGAHPQGGAERARRVVLMGDGCPEPRDHRVADELLHRAALGLDLLAHGREVAIEDLAKLFGIEPLAQCGGAAEVGEQERDELAFVAAAGGVDGRAGTARGTEPGIPPATARRTSHRER